MLCKLLQALDLKKLQTPLYEEFYNSTLNAAGPPSAVGKSHDNVTNFLNLPPKSRSPNRTPTRRLSAAVDAACISNSANHTKRGLNVGTISDRTLKEIQSPQLSEWKELLLDAQQEPVSLRFVYWCWYLFDHYVPWINHVFFPFYMLRTKHDLLAAQTSLRDEENGKKSLIKSLRRNEASYTFSPYAF